MQTFHMKNGGPQHECPFCEVSDEIIVHQTITCYAMWDKNPVSKGHSLIIPLEHGFYFDLPNQSKRDLWIMVELVKDSLDLLYEPDGYNIGMNIGQAAGQTVEHTHIHVIPRYIGDMKDPRGGVRGVIPRKRKYKEKQ